MNSCVGCRHYLVTYSQADESKFSIRESFGNMLEAEFNAGTRVIKVDYWACYREEQQNDVSHYHCALKLTGFKKCLSVKSRIAEKHGIQFNFVDKNNFYLSAYIYVCKSDQEVAHSENYPPRLLTAASQKAKKSFAGLYAACATKRKSTQGKSSCAVVKKQNGLTNLDLAEFIRERGIRRYTEVLGIAEEQRTAGEMGIAELVFKRNEKILRELVTKTWQIESS